MSRLTYAMVGALLWALGGCTDATNVAREDAEAPIDDGAVEQPELGPRDGGPEPEPDAFVEVDMAAPRPAWIEVSLDPRRALYATSDAVEVSARVFDRQGEVFEAGAFAIEWRVAPEGLGAVVDGVLRFTGEGPGTVLACADGVCGRAAVFVDAGPPTLVVESPARGAIIDGEGGRTLTVSGTATDSAGAVEVRVNGAPVVVGAEGRFEVAVDATFGVNRIEVSASDGVQAKAVVDVRDVLWAPSYTPVDARGVTIPGAVTLRADQALLDTDNPVVIRPEAGDVRVGDLAQLLDALVRIIDVSALLPDPQIATGPPLDLRLLGLDLGVPEIDMVFTLDGIELFLVLPEAVIETAGELVIEGESISLDGGLVAELSAFARLDVGIGETLSVEVGEVLVNLDSVRGRYESDTANALVESLGTLLGNLARDLAAGLVSDLVEAELPALIDAALGEVLGTIASVPLQFDTGIEGAPPIDLELRVTPAAVTLRRASLMQLAMDARIEHREDVVAPHPDPGVPTLAGPEWEEAPGQGLGASVRFALLNGLLHEVWRTGLLQLAPPLPDQISAVLGEVRLDATSPPVVAPAPLGAALPLEVQIGDLRMRTQGRAAPAPDIYALSLRVGAGVRVDGASIELVLGDDPDIDAVLIEQGSAFPLLTEMALAQLIEAVVWPMVQDALGEGLAFGIDPIAVDPAALGEYAPRLLGLSLAPRFREAPRVEGGRLTLEGAIDVRLTLGPDGEAPVEEPPVDEPPPGEPPAE